MYTGVSGHKSLITASFPHTVVSKDIRRIELISHSIMVCVHVGRVSVFLTCIIALFLRAGAEPVVQTTLGEIHGISTEVTVGGVSYTVNRFLGIPFAEPPVGNLRFRKPQPLSQLTSPFNASKFGYICPQVALPGIPLDGIENEDCLHLNVYVPVRTADRPAGHAVMIWIYGGSFILGSSNTYDATALVAHGNVIYVTVNYRVGPFGFLSTKDENCPGNFGLWDQRLAIEWVNDHIAAFGGDVNRITIFGESAGGISTSIQGMYPGNKGLFQRLISQSGVSSVKFIHTTRDTMPLVHAIADKIGCQADDTLAIIECMRRSPWEQYMDAVSTMFLDPNLILFLIFDPVVDGELIKFDPKLLGEMEKEGPVEELEFFRKLDVINGFNRYEGGISMQYFTSADMNDFKPTSADMMTLIPMATVVFYQREVSTNVSKLIAHQYTDWSDPYNYESIRLQYCDIHGDAGFAVPAVSTSLLHAAGNRNNSYLYTFVPAPTHRFVTTPTWVPEADHGDEIQYMMGLLPIGTELNTPYENWERELSLTMMTYWTNFAKTG